MEACHSFLKNSPMMAYLAMMAPRLVELTHAHGGAKRFGPVHDSILFYAKSKYYKWNGRIYAYLAKLH